MICLGVPSKYSACAGRLRIVATFVRVVFFIELAMAGPVIAQQPLPREAQDAQQQTQPHVPDSQDPTAPSTSPDKSEPQRGYAAFYSPSLEGHKTACGGVYSPDKFTAAHRSLPCGTRLRVTNLRNGKTIRVTVTDHGPLSHGRILDLSYAAARRLDFIKQGTTLVKVEIIR